MSQYLKTNLCLTKQRTEKTRAGKQDASRHESFLCGVERVLISRKSSFRP